MKTKIKKVLGKLAENAVAFGVGLTVFAGVSFAAAGWSDTKTSADVLLANEWNDMAAQVQTWSRDTSSGGAVTLHSDAGSVGIGANTNVGGTLDVTGNATFSSTLDVTGNATFSSTLDVTGNATVDGTLGVTGALTAQNGLTVSAGALSGASATFSSTLDVTGNTNVGGTLGVTGALTATGGLKLSKILTATACTAAGDAGKLFLDNTTGEICVCNSTGTASVKASDFSSACS